MQLLKVFLFLSLISLIACDTSSINSKSNDDSNKEAGNNENNQNIPAVYNGFYNYPTGRVDQTGKLTIQNQAATDVLLFNGSVTAENYLGTVNSLGSVLLKMPDEKFYSIVAVDKSTYEEKTIQASQTSSFAYYSNTLTNKVNVTAIKSSGSGTWVISNQSNYWATFTSIDRTQNYAVIAPETSNVNIPIEPYKYYDFRIFLTKEITLNGKTIGVVETTDTEEVYDSAIATESNNYQFKTITSDFFVPTLKPSILVINNLDKDSVYTNKSSTQLTNGTSTLDSRLAVIAGSSQLYGGFEAGDNINTINFENKAWTENGHENLFVTENIKMENGKLYIITLSGSDIATINTSVEVVDAETYFEANK